VDYIPGVAGPGSELIANLHLDYKIGSVHFVEQFENGKHWEIDHSAEVFEQGLHDIFDGGIEEAVKRYYELIRKMILEEKPDIVGHLDKIKMHNTEKLFFDEKESWYKDEVLKTLTAIEASGVIVEVNTRGLYKGKSKDYYPSMWVLEQMKKMEIPITVSSDAHKPEEIILGFPEVTKALVGLGYSGKMVLVGQEWRMVNF
jgi:histidinol-phosphatase (PHP family)